jgi:sec-independent protein translocase protein TatC
MNKAWLENLRELRQRLIWILCVYIIFVILVFYYKDFFYSILILPILKATTSAKLISIDLISSVLVPIKLLLYIALLLQMPHLFFQIWYFVTHGLSKKENKIFIFIAIFSAGLIILALLFSVYVILPGFFKIITSYQLFPISLFTDIEKYCNFIFTVILGTIICFQIPIIVLILLLCNIVTITQFKYFRKYAFIIAFVLAAVITPPDILSQFLLAIPIYLLYELSLLSWSIIKNLSL